MQPKDVKLSLHTLYWLLAFFQGVLYLLEFPTSFYKVGMPLIVTILLLEQVKNRHGRFIAKGIVIYLLLVFISIISGLNNDIDFFSIIYFIRDISLHYLYFLILINENDKRIFNRIYKVIVVLFLIQLPAALVKLFVIGVAEKVIGTISPLSGSLSTIIPAFVSIILLVTWFDKRKNIYIILIIFYLGFGLIGGKRAVIFILPIFLFIAYIFYLYLSEPGKKVSLLSKMLPLSLLVLIIFYVTARINPTLNPGNKVWGSFDFNYVINYTEDYSTTEKVRTRGDVPRIEAWAYFLALQSNKGIIPLLLGDGAGKLIISSYNENAGENPMVEYYNVFYGGRMGAMWLFLQIGLIGVFLYFALFFKIIRYTLKNNSSPGEKTVIYSVILLFFFDGFYYSKTFIYYQALIGVFFTYLAYLKKRKEWK